MPFDPSVYRLASIARDKLCREASRASHDLRCLVAHANLLDELLVELNAPKGGPAERYGFDILPQDLTDGMPEDSILTSVKQFRGSVVEDDARDPESRDPTPLNLPMLSHDPESDSDSSSDSDNDSDDSDDYTNSYTQSSLRTTTTSVSEVDEEDLEEDLEEDTEALALHRTPSIWRLFGSSPSEEPKPRRTDKPRGTISSRDLTALVSTT